MLTASRSALTAALKLTADVLERRHTIPILANVLVEDAGPGRAAIRMTDLDIEARVELEAGIDAGFTPFTVPGGLLREIVTKLPDKAEIGIDLKPGSPSAAIGAGRSRFSLHVLPASDFPDMSFGDMPYAFSLPAKAFASALSAVAFAISTEETRYYLNGVYLHPVEGGALLVATDGHRLAKRFVAAADAPPFPGIIVPRKTVAVLMKALPADGDIDIACSDQKIRFAWPGVTLTSKLIDGTFPDYRRVIPEHGPMLVEIEGAALKAAVDRVQVVAGDRGRAMKFSFSAGVLTLSVKNPDSGDGEETLAYEGQAEIETGFNAKYVLDVIGHLSGETITAAIQDAGSPAVFRADGDHVDNLIVLMPMLV